VTRTLARLLEHLRAEGHEALVLGPETGMVSSLRIVTGSHIDISQSKYAGYSVIGTFGIPLVLYPGLKLNFARPRFINELLDFQPDVRAMRRALLHRHN